MSYRPGVAGLFEAFAFVFVITSSRSYLTSLSIYVEQAAQFAWLSVLLAGLFSGLAVYVLLYVFARVPGDLFDVSKQLLGRVGAWTISLYYLLIFWVNAVLLLRQFAENTLSTALPEMKFELIMAFYTIFATHLCFLSLSGIVRTSGLFLWYTVGVFFLICFLLLPYYNMYQLMPWQGHGISTGLKLGVTGAGTNLGVIALFVMAPSFQSLRTIRASAFYGLGLSVSVKSIHTLVCLMVFGLTVSIEKMLSFYEMARAVYLNRYLQHIEALLILIWVIVGLLSIAASMYVAMYILARLLDLPALRPFLPLMMLITANLAFLFESVDTVLAAEALYGKISLIGLYGIPAILWAVTFAKLRNKPCVRQ